VALLALASIGAGRGRPSLVRVGAFLAGGVLVFAPIAVANQRSNGPLLTLGAAALQQWLVNNEHATGA
jgi:hypothetical protein